MFVCDVNDFLASYGPCQNGAEPDPDVEACFKEMISQGLVKEREDGEYTLSAYATERPSQFGREFYDEAAGFHDVKEIVDFVLNSVNLTQGKGEIGMRFIVVPNKNVEGHQYPNEGTIKGYFVFSAETHGVQNREINVPVEFKQRRCIMSRNEVHKDMLRACSQVMEEDIRRMWIYGLSFEDSLLSVWYFSRSHSVKTETFNWIKYPKDFVRVLFAFAKATPHELGFDPTISIGPDNEDGKASYVYQVPASGDPHRFFKTVQTIFYSGSRSIVGRATRVSTAVEVTSADGKHPVNPLKTVVVKDVWLNEDGSKTEDENLDALFASVDEYVGTGLEALKQRDPAATRAQLIEQLVESDPRFKHFDQASKARLCLNLTDHAYRSLFLTKLHSWKGEVSRPIGQNVWRSDRTLAGVYYEENVYRRSESFNNFHTSQFIAADSKFDGLGKRDEEDRRRFPPRRQSRFIYEEVCTTLQYLDTMGDVVDVLRQTMDAMHILFLAGWVHRDISPSNIMAYRSSPDKPWAVKIADLEFARPMVDDTRKPDPDFAVGTAISIPVEILSKEHLLHQFTRFECEDNNGHDTLAAQLDASTKGQDYVDNLKCFNHFGRVFEKETLLAEVPSEPCWDKVPKSGSTPVNHNFQHDLECIWWTLIWIVTTRIGNKETVYDCFVDTYQQPLTRERILMNGLSRLRLRNDWAKEVICTIFPKLEDLRKSIYRHYLMREVFGRLEVPESYSSIYAAFSATLGFIQAIEGPWRDVPLRKKSSSTVQPDVAEIVNGTPENAEKRKRESESQEDVTADEDQRAPKRKCE